MSEEAMGRGNGDESGLEISEGCGNAIQDEGDGLGEDLHMDESHDFQNDSSGFIMEQDRFLPIANVARIMKRVIPPSGKIAKDAKECCQECVSEFISFITSEASERCQHEKRKTINGEDLLFAMSNLGFENYIEPLKVYLSRYRDAQKGDKGAGSNQAQGSMEKDGADPFTALLGNLGVTAPPTLTREAPNSASQPTQHITLQVTGAGGQPQQIQVPVVYAMDPSGGGGGNTTNANNYVTIQTPQGLQLIQLASNPSNSTTEAEGE